MTIEKPDLIDALPFIDTHLDDDNNLRDHVLKLVEEETKNSSSQSQTDELPERPFLTPMLRDGLEKLEQKIGLQGRLPGLSEIRTDSPPPVNAKSSDDIKCWVKCLNQVKIKLEYRQRQLANLELLKTYSVPVWEQYMIKMDKMKDDMDEELRSLNSRIKDIDINRKLNQEQASRHLDVQQSNWENLMIRNQMLSEEIERFREELRRK